VATNPKAKELENLFRYEVPMILKTEEKKTNAIIE
jgi:hypothetical protein